MSLSLQPRDRELLAGIQRFGVLSTVQIGHWYFKNVAKTTVLRRIRMLEAGHYLKRGVSLENGTNTWGLGFKGREMMGVETSVQFSNRNSIKHDILLNDIRRKLESFGVAKDVTPEFELKSEVFRNYRYGNAKEQLVPDALVIESVKSETQAISLELELTVKSQKRYEKIFMQYGLKTSITRIWYFCNSAKEILRILNFAQKHWSKIHNRMWFSTNDEFLKSEMPRIWVASDRKWVLLSNIGFDQFKMPTLEKMNPRPAHIGTQGVRNQRRFVGGI